jgi:hypothetical protein
MKTRQDEIREMQEQEKKAFTKVVFVGAISLLLTLGFMIHDYVYAKDEIIIKDDKIVVCKPPVNGVVVCY